MPHPLSRFRILLADADAALAEVLRGMLAHLGFADVRATRSGRDALTLLGEEPYDFLITEWRLEHLDGFELTGRIRRDPGSPNPMLPILMLTGRAAPEDVLAARDRGVNEFVAKPFSALAVASRLGRIVERPRPFVVSPGFVGPDRRHRPAPGDGPDRRHGPDPTMPPPGATPRDMTRGGRGPRVWLPDHALGSKLRSAAGPDATLDALITPAALNRAQAEIDAIGDAAPAWVRDDLAALRVLAASSAAPADLAAAAADLQHRAASFGLGPAARAAQLLARFCRDHLRPGEPAHRVVVAKHLEALQVLLSDGLRGDAGPGTDAGRVLAGLRDLADKYTW